MLPQSSTPGPAEPPGHPGSPENLKLGSAAHTSQADCAVQCGLISALLDSIPDIVFYKDTNGVYLGCNAEFARHLGWNKNDIPGKTDYDLYPREEADFSRDNDRKMLEALQPRHNDEWITYPDGRRVLLDTLKTPYRSQDGRLIGILAVSRDITERRQAEERITTLVQEKDLLLKETHHRIKNSFAVIESLLGIQVSRAYHPETVSALQDARSRVGSMRILYEKLLYADQYRQLQAEPYLKEIALHVIQSFGNPDSIRFIADTEDVLIDARQAFPLGAITAELLTNSLKHAYDRDNTRVVALNLARDGSYAVLEISDQGKGVPDGFDMENGSGFGLTLVKMLVEQIGGRFMMHTETGTRCVVTFKPGCDASAQPSPPEGHTL
jgi:PAS domain S-box-containing protein